jgi:predicted nucleic acid-binding protein
MGTQKLILVDTNILIDLFKKKLDKNILSLITKGSLFVSPVSTGELFFGMDKGEKKETVAVVNRLVARLYT